MKHLLLLLTVIAFNASAQENNDWDGLWKYTHADKSRGWPADVEISLTGNTGTYYAHLGRHRIENSPCRDKAFPITVIQSSPNEIVFHVEGENIVKKCPIFDAKFTRTGVNSADGIISRGQQVTMIRSN